MAADKKNKIKRAVLSWLCLAVLASGSLPGSFSGIIPTMSAAAEETVTYVSEIDLAELVNYKNGTTTSPTGVSVFNTDNGYSLRIDQSGTYKLRGSNYINNSYVDVRIQTNSGVNATIICDDVYIKNDYGDCFSISGGSVNNHSYFTPFESYRGSMTLSGKVTVETYFCQGDNFFAPVTTRNVTGSFFSVTYKDSSGNTLGKTSYLSGGTYEDKSGIPANYACVTSNGALFDYNNITAAATVTCSDHTPDANGKCTNCGEVYLVDLAKLVDYKNGTAECPYGLGFNTPEDFSDILEVTFTKSGTYKFTGSNLINGSYLDVKFIIADGVDVILDCDDAFLKNDKGVRVENDNWNVENYPTNEPVYSHELVASGYFTLYNYVHPFSVGENATVNFTGKLFVDTFSDNNYVSMFDDHRDTPNNIYGIYYYLNGSSHGKKFFVSGTEYDLSDYAVDFHCIKNIENNSPGIYTFRNNWLDAYIYTHHNIPESSDTCTQCGLQFGAIYTVTVDDTINSPTTHRVAENDTFDCPTAPTAPVGKKFTG